MKTEYVLCKKCGEKIKVNLNLIPGNYIVVSTSKNEKIAFKSDINNTLSKKLEVMEIKSKPSNLVMFSNNDDSDDDILSRHAFTTPPLSSSAAEATEICLTCENGHEDKYTIYL